MPEVSRPGPYSHCTAFEPWTGGVPLASLRAALTTQQLPPAPFAEFRPIANVPSLQRVCQRQFRRRICLLFVDGTSLRPSLTRHRLLSRFGPLTVLDESHARGAECSLLARGSRSNSASRVIRRARTALLLVHPRWLRLLALSPVTVADRPQWHRDSC